MADRIAQLQGGCTLKIKNPYLALLLSLLFVACAAAAVPAEPTATAGAPPDIAIAAQCENGPKERNFPRFARLMHDPQWMEWPSRMGDPEWPRGFYYDWYPETVQLTTGPRSGDGSVSYNRPWLEYLRDLQPNAETATWITRIAAGLFNRAGNSFIPIHDLDDLDEEPTAEAISSGGNVVKVLETRNGSARIEMLYLNSDPPDVDEVNYYLTPWLVTKFTSVSVDGQLGNAGGIDTYFPNLAKNTKGYWVDLKRVEWFPHVPVCVTAKSDLRVLSHPNVQGSSQGPAKHVGTIAEGEQLTIREYLPQASDVWGRTDEGWVRLQYLNAGGVPVFTTTWEMDTRPPILFP